MLLYVDGRPSKGTTGIISTQSKEILVKRSLMIRVVYRKLQAERSRDFIDKIEKFVRVNK